jgi:double-stranded uracil-DNA glycosylase
MEQILSDVLQPNLKVVFCGTAAGDTSARLRLYYADPRNRFWGILHDIGLTPTKLRPPEYEKVVQYGIGLTDLAKYVSGTDDKLMESDYDIEGLITKVRKYSPRILALTSKETARIFLGKRKLDYGLQMRTIGNTSIYVLPSTSGGNGHWGITYQYWYKLADMVR